MKTIFRSFLISTLALISFAAFAMTDCDVPPANGATSSSFCACYMNNFRQTCPKYEPAAQCRRDTPRSVKKKIKDSGGVERSCRIQKDTSFAKCLPANTYFYNHC